jgi:hypothetical protein
MTLADFFALLVVTWLALILLYARRHVLGIRSRLERKEIIFWIIIIIWTVVPGTLSVMDYFAKHPISIPMPQGNATTSRNITIVMPEFIRPLPSPQVWVTLVILGAGIVAGTAMAIYNARKGPEPPQPPSPLEVEGQPETTSHIQPPVRKKLETLHAKLTRDPENTGAGITSALQWFESDIESAGYLKAVEDLSPELVTSFNEMRKRMMDLMPSKDNPITHKEARAFLGDEEYEKQASSGTVSVSWINVWWNRLRDSPEVQTLINKMRAEIQDLLARGN